MLALDGAVWGVGAAWGMQAGVQTGAVVAASVVGVASVATFGLQVRLLAAAAYVVPIMLPSIASLLLRADEFGVLLAMGLTLVTINLGTSNGIAPGYGLLWRPCARSAGWRSLRWWGRSWALPHPGFRW